jgi:hypothetical protein
MSSNSPFEAGDRVRVAERGLSGRISERLSWVGKVVSVKFPWVRVRDERGTIYERHARTLRPVDAHTGRTRLTSVGGQMAVIMPPKERPKMEFEMPEPVRRRRRKGPAEIADSGIAILPARAKGRKKTVSRLSELEGPTVEEKEVGKAFVQARREAKRLERKRKELEARRSAAKGETPATPPRKARSGGTKKAAATKTGAKKSAVKKATAKEASAKKAPAKKASPVAATKRAKKAVAARKGAATKGKPVAAKAKAAAAKGKPTSKIAATKASKTAPKAAKSTKSRRTKG